MRCARGLRIAMLWTSRRQRNEI